MAAVLACAAGAVVSHRSGAALWGLFPARAADAPVEVAVVGGSNRGRPGILVRRTSALEPDERSVVEGIPVTAPGRTLVDLAAVAAARDVERALARAEREQLVAGADLPALITRYGSRPGVRLLRAVACRAGGPAMTRSEAEERFLSLIREADLPVPEVNVPVGGYEVDFLWRGRGLAVEVDGYRFHASRPSFEHDRRRATRLAALGIHVIPLTWRQLVEERTATAVQLGQALLRAERR